VSWSSCRSLRYRNKAVTLPDGSELTFPVGEEKGVDIRIALDVIRMAHRGDYDAAVILSQDQDFTEVADEIRVIAQERGRWIKIVSAYPIGPTTRNRRGINRTDWVPISRAMYDECLDRRDYRPIR
jgi:predicted AAA+ superfamily ATPase